MRKAEVLLAYLALAPGIRHPRERLINLLWSDRGEEQARNSLRQCLSAIRKSLGDAADLILQIDRTTVSLKPGLIDVDALEFEQLAMEGDFESLSTAAGLYRGEFLEGISIRDAASQDWLDGERARFKRQFVEILVNLGETQLISHDFNAAIKSTERLVEQDPLGESGWRLLMRSYADNGDRSHALQAFKRCEKAIRDELDVDPEAATIELRDQIAGGGGKPAQLPAAGKLELSVNVPAASAPASGETSVDPETASDHSIAVLPFDNLSGDSEQEYFSDGITDSIILNLSMFPGLQVKSRNSSFAFKQQIKSPGEISRELEVDYIVEGSIRKSQEKVRITVQLIEAASGNQVWGKRYDADIDNLFDLEEDLSRTIAATVTGQIESDLQRIALAKGAAHQQSYDLLLSGEYHVQRFTRQDNLIAIEKLNQCLAQDPDNVRAHIGLYGCYSMSYLERWVEDFETSLELAAKHIHTALALDPDAGNVQTFYAEYLIFCGELDKAGQHLNKALKINPNDPNTLANLTLNLELQGEFEAALKMAEKTFLLDPYHPWIEWEIAGSQYLCGHYEAALQTIANSRTPPNFMRMFCVASNIKLGQIDAAKQAFQVFMEDCRQSMFAIPKTMNEWYRYIRDNYPFRDEILNQDIIDCLVQAGLEDRSLVAAGPRQSDEHSIAVLPFDNLSGDPEQEYFSDGITDSIILNLSRFPGLQVKSRNSSFAFKQQIKNLGEISRELNVDYIVEGSIRKSVDRIRITVQLIEAASGNQVWGKRYDVEIENLFDLEEELSRTIATTVTGQIETDLQRIAIAKGAAHPQAYDLLLQGIFHCGKSTPKDCAIAIAKLNQCLTLDPNNALAHATLYSCHEMNWIDRWVSDFEASRKLCEVHASKALALNPELGQVQVSYANYLTFNRDYDEAEAHLKKALGINPNDSEAIASLALNFSSLGKFEAALEQARLAIQLDPYHTWARWILTEAQFFCGQYEEALTTIAETGNPPGFLQIHKINANIRLNRMDVARETLTTFLQNCRNSMLSMPRNIDEWLAYSQDNSPFADPAINQEIIDCLVQAGLEGQLIRPQQNDDSSQQPGILVLPFSNLSGDPEQEYFSDGISESIIVNLSSFSGLNVKSRHTSFAFRNSAKSIDEIAEELSVQYIVEGSIRKFGDKVRITVQVDETASGNQLWGKRFESDLENLFALEEELVKSISGSIGGRIGKDIKSVSMRKPAKDLKSYDYLMRGVHHLEKFNAADVAIALTQFQKCLEHDPENSEAHAMMGVSHLTELFENWSVERAESKRLMFLYSEKALQLEPENSVAHAFMAEALMYSGDFERAAHHVERAIELNPNLPDGYAIKGSFLASTRCYEEALEYADKSLQVDPHHFYMCWNAGEVYRGCGQFERAIRTFRSMPHTPSSVHAQIAASLAGLGKIDEARAEMQRYLESARTQMPNCPVNKEEWHSYWLQYMPYQYKEDSEPFFQLLLKAGLCDEVTLLPDNQPSIAVLPFENLSGDPEQEYFSDGITASILLSLGLFKGLTVKSQNSSFALKKSGKSSEEIAAELKTTYLVEGSIRKSAHKVRISVQLIESASGNQIWGKQYDAELEDILELEQELSQTIAGTISGRIGHTLQQSAVRKPAKDPQSYDYLLRGLYYFGKFTASDFAKARHEIGKCLEIDPENATAHTNLGELLWVEILEGWTDDQANSDRLSRFHLETAIEIEPDNALAHSYFGEYLFFKKDYEQSEFHVDKAIELNPTAAEGYVTKADLLGMTRRIDEAIPYAEKALQLDPHSVGAGWAAGGVYQNAEQFEKAIRTYRSIPHPPASIHASIAACLSALGLDVEARREMKRYQELAKRDMPNYPADKSAWRNLWQTYLAYQHKEDFEAAFEQLIGAGLLEDLSGNPDDTPSIAVLPFENMSGDPEQEHFSDGITTDIIATLSRFEHMRTVLRYSVLQYKDQRASIPEIAQQQNVRYILEGSVRKSGNSIRVSAELIDSKDEKICWSERYDRDLDDLFAVQDEITKNIALAMKVQLDDGDMALHRSTGTSNIKAWQLTLAAIDLQDTYIRENILEARRMAKQAIDLDPDYPYAWVALGWTHWQEVYSGWSDSPEDSLIEAEKAQQKANDLEPQYSEAWSLGGLIHLMRHKPTQALEYCRKAVELEPGNAETQALMAFCLIYVGDYESARQHEQTMQKLCPVLPNWYFLIGGEIAQIQGNFEQAATCFQQGIDVEPNSPLCRFYLIDVMMELGNEPRARAVADEIKALDNEVTGKGLVRTVSQDKAMRKRFQTNLEKFDLY